MIFSPQGFTIDVKMSAFNYNNQTREEEFSQKSQRWALKLSAQHRGLGMQF